MPNMVDIDAAYGSIGNRRSIKLFGEEHSDIKEVPYQLGLALNDVQSLPPAEQDALVLQALQHVFGAERFSQWENNPEWTQSHLQLLFAYILSGFKTIGVEAAADRIVEGKNLPAEGTVETPPLTSSETLPLFTPTSEENTGLTLTTPENLPGDNSLTSSEG